MESFETMKTGIASEDITELQYLLFGFSLVEGMIQEDISLRQIPDISIASLALSVRSYHCLNRSGYYYVSDLLGVTIEEIGTIRNMGRKSLEEVIDKVTAYVKADHKLDEQAEQKEQKELPETVQISPSDIFGDEPVLAEDYGVDHEMIYSRISHKVVQDAPIEALDLSVRSYNCLRKNGKYSIAHLIGMPIDELRKMRNMGVKSLIEIQEKLERYLENKQEESVTQGIGIPAISQKQVLARFQDHPFSSFSVQELMEYFADATEEDLQEVLGSLVDSQKLYRENDMYFILHKSFFDALDDFSRSGKGADERAADVIRLRASGNTLEEIGRIMDITRERVRQIETKTFRKITQKGFNIFEEDRYAYLFSTYSLGNDFYLDDLNIGQRELYYLAYCYKRGINPISSALEDKRISVDIRKRISWYLHQEEILVDGEYLQLKRGTIEDFLLKKYCREEVSIDEFFELYETFVQEYGITDEKLQLIDVVRRTRASRLAASHKLLWKQNQRLRYYDIEAGDYTELLAALDLAQYENIEVSTRKFMMDYPELMKRYDLRDEYEVHNLLKKIHAQTENESLIFGRMPNLQFGTFDRDMAVKEMLFAVAPISLDDFAEVLSSAYGARVNDIKANWLNGIKEYYHQGIYFTDYEEMPQEMLHRLKEALTDDFYFLPEVQKKFKALFPEGDISLLSTFNLKRMGFLCGSSYVIQNYPSAEAFINHLLTENDIFDVITIKNRYGRIRIYYQCLSALKHDLEIIEFEPDQFIHIRRLEKLGYGKGTLRAYADRVWSSLVSEDYFTISSLRADGFEDELDCLGFSDVFYGSLLKEDERFAWQKIGGTIVLNSSGENFTTQDFLASCVQMRKSIDVNDFASELSERYGVSMDRYKIIEKVKGSSVYYDPIMERLYADYDTYFEEI